MMPDLGMHVIVAALVADGDAALLPYPMVPRDEWMLVLEPGTDFRYLAPAPA